MPILQRKKDNVDLRNFYHVYLQLGLIVTLFIMIVMFRANLDLDSNIEFNVQEQETIEMEEIVQTEQVTKPPPPPRPPVPVEVPNDEIIDDMDLNLDASLDLDMALDLPPPPPAAKQVVVEDEEPEIFLVVEEDPELIGGLEGLQRSIRYPEIARKAGIEGRVFVQFVVDEKGNVIDPVVTRGIGGGCDEAALEAVRKAKFKPGKQRGRPVKVQYSLPVTFRLQN
jgi:periplasmic protein TonB